MAGVVDPYGTEDTSKSRKFIITELQPSSSDKKQVWNDTNVRFEWDSRSQSSPRGGWELPVKVRTVREDYPGAERPTEQVLGFNFEPFTLEGVWDDRYAGKDFAENTRTAFEAMVLRGNMCRFEYGKVTIYGIITNFRPKAIHANDSGFFRVSYSFTVSPHFKNPAGDLRSARNNTRGGQAVANPRHYLEQTRAIVNAQQDTDSAALQSMMSSLMTGDTYNTLKSIVSGWSASADRIETIVRNQVLAAKGGNGLSAVVAEFTAMKNSALDLLPLTASLRSDADLAFDSAVGNLAFEAWLRKLNASARNLALVADAAADDLGRRITPDAKALYRPRANESLYAISTHFYGTPHKWRLIATRNNLHTFTMTGAELLIIPEA